MFEPGWSALDYQCVALAGAVNANVSVFLGRLWTSSGGTLSSLLGHTDAVTSLRILPAGPTTCKVVTASKDRTLRLWKVSLLWLV
jgi:WD40 repeat protein